MLLDFYRYEYPQKRLAAGLGLGTAANPKDLASGQEGKVVEVIESLSGNALNVTMHKDPTWADFHDEILANRPVISFVPGHARTIAGYTDTGPISANLGTTQCLLVYDPWPPPNGVVSVEIYPRDYTFAFTARLQLA